MKEASLRRRLVSLSGLCLMSMVLTTQISGYALSWGAITVYVTSYLHIYDSQASLSLVGSALNYSVFPYALGSSEV